MCASLARPRLKGLFTISYPLPITMQLLPLPHLRNQEWQCGGSRNLVGRSDSGRALDLFSLSLFTFCKALAHALSSHQVLLLCRACFRIRRRRLLDIPPTFDSNASCRFGGFPKKRFVLLYLLHLLKNLHKHAGICISPAVNMVLPYVQCTAVDFGTTLRWCHFCRCPCCVSDDCAGS